MTGESAESLSGALRVVICLQKSPIPFRSIDRRIERFSGWLIVPRNWHAGLQLQPEAARISARKATIAKGARRARTGHKARRGYHAGVSLWGFAPSSAPAAEPPPFRSTLHARLRLRRTARFARRRARSF